MFAVFYRAPRTTHISYYGNFATFEAAQAFTMGATFATLPRYERSIVPLRAVARVTGQADVEDFRGEEVV